MKKVVIAVVDKKTGRALMWANSLKEIASTGQCAEGSVLMCLTWDSYMRRYQGGQNEIVNG